MKLHDQLDDMTSAFWRRNISSMCAMSFVLLLLLLESVVVCVEQEHSSASSKVASERGSFTPDSLALDSNI